MLAGRQTAHLLELMGIWRVNIQQAIRAAFGEMDMFLLTLGIWHSGIMMGHQLLVIGVRHHLSVNRYLGVEKAPSGPS